MDYPSKAIGPSSQLESRYFMIQILTLGTGNCQAESWLLSMSVFVNIARHVVQIPLLDRLAKVYEDFDHPAANTCE
jgi:hypothetical protein